MHSTFGPRALRQTSVLNAKILSPRLCFVLSIHFNLIARSQSMATVSCDSALPWGTYFDALHAICTSYPNASMGHNEGRKYSNSTNCLELYRLCDCSRLGIDDKITIPSVVAIFASDPILTTNCRSQAPLKPPSLPPKGFALRVNRSDTLACKCPSCFSHGDFLAQIPTMRDLCYP